MGLSPSIIGLITIAAAILLAQPPDQTRAKEAALKNDLLILRQAIDKYTFECLLRRGTSLLDLRSADEHQPA